MFRCRKGDWRWRFVSEAAAEEVGDPLDRTGAQIVQRRSEGRFDRCVWRRDGFYFKHETLLGSALSDRWTMRFRPRTTQEFASILLLKRCGIPVVEPVGCGGNGRSSLLITREKTGFVTVREQLRRFEAAGEAPPEAFLAGWSAMTAALFRNRLYLYDFHCGNMLCRWPAGDFAIIDPQGVKRGFVDVEKRQLRMIRRQYGEFFGETTREVVQKMLASILPGEDSETLYRRLLIRIAAYIRTHALADRRRLEDFRRGKFSRVIDGVEWRLDVTGEPLSGKGTEALALPPERAAQFWERDWRFSLFYLPLLRIVGRDATSGVLYRQCAGPGEVTEAERRELLERVEIAGFDPGEFVCRRDLRGRARLEDIGPR